MKTLLLNTKPVSVNQRYTIARGRNILSNTYRDAKALLKWEIKSQWEGEPLDQDVAVNVIVKYKGRKPDIDAYCKILFDALEGIALKNDGLISEAHIYREKVEDRPSVIIQLVYES